MQALVHELKSRAAALGFNRVGIIPASPAQHLAAYLRWIDAGHHGTMAYMARPDRVERRQDPHVILPDMKSIVCVGLDYSTRSIPPEISNDPSRGRISNYAWGIDYHDIMTPRLAQLAAWLSEQDSKIRSRVYVDTGAILERDHASTAGLGFIGKNTMLIDPRGGSWFFLGELLTTLRLQDDEPLPPLPGCGTCSRCLDMCPTEAFPAPYILDSRRCISYLTIELKGWIPLELRPLMANWIYGCDACQEVCPFTRFVNPTKEPAFRSNNWEDTAPSLLDLLVLDEEGFNLRFAGSPIRRIKRSRLVRNACVAVGNWGSATAVPSLIALLADPVPLVRGHAAWALRRIGNHAAHQAVESAFANEQDERVRMEMRGY
jgi:epoxyqueuosine reductase